MKSLASFPGRCALRLSELGEDESGQGMVEYAFIVVMVALVVILTVVIIGNQTSNMWHDVSNTLLDH